mmetsp:Transcript_28263/g.81344  ORF Transcript_28263/g.81344 Transcript_28263/m.81344 type:complete len:221 (+) Transcript_28263:985-1647(+)
MAFAPRFPRLRSFRGTWARLSMSRRSFVGILRRRAMICGNAHATIWPRTTAGMTGTCCNAQMMSSCNASLVAGSRLRSASVILFLRASSRSRWRCSRRDARSRRLWLWTSSLSSAVIFDLAIFILFGGSSSSLCVAACTIPLTMLPIVSTVLESGSSSVGNASCMPDSGVPMAHSATSCHGNSGLGFCSARWPCWSRASPSPSRRGGRSRPRPRSETSRH